MVPKLPKIDTPTFVYWGAHDPVIKSDWSDNIGEFFSSITVEIAEDAGHFVHYEVPERSAKKIESFFGNLK